MAQCIHDLHDVLDDNWHDISKKYITYTPLFSRYDLVSDVCSAAKDHDIVKLDDLVEQLLNLTSIKVLLSK